MSFSVSELYHVSDATKRSLPYLIPSRRCYMFAIWFLVCSACTNRRSDVSMMSTYATVSSRLHSLPFRLQLQCQLFIP